MKIYITGTNTRLTKIMFVKLGFEISEHLTDTGVVCFSGGEDVNPALYGEEPHPLTTFNESRDAHEIRVYEYALSRGIPMIGICRGAQFLHVMNGGKLWQHVNNHAIGGTHEATDVLTNETFMVTSTHHQMMKVGVGEIVCFAEETDLKEGVLIDLEVVYHKSTLCLCFQPHPEIVGADSTYLYFKNLLERFNYIK